MGDPVIRIDKIGKQYHIGAKKERYKTLRDTIADAFAAPFRRAGKLLRGHATGAAGLDEVIWALKDVSFEVEQGEVVGIIGRNGAGKSTILKILSRITEPTSGVGEIRGRIGSLLEVGTGFHPELTGRENIYLNGAILGMKKKEIDDKFDEMVDFSEVDKFIDTPVKHYSSGMYLRLAFSVAAHMEPEILIVDEVLAVGDANFQKKCLNKMQDVSKLGRTVLFVSHNMPAVTRLCSRVILLNEGSLIQDGPSHEVVRSYLNNGQGAMSVREWPNAVSAPGGDIARLRAVRVKTEEGRIAESFDIRYPVLVEMEYDVLREGYVLMPNFNFYNEDGIYVFKALDQDMEWRKRKRPKGRYVSATRIPGNFLAEGMLFVTAALTSINPTVNQYHERDAVAFQIIDSTEGDSVRGDFVGRMPGVVRPYLRWTTAFSPNGHN
ncbi:MAG: ABC transporter ATP-binding protein [Nitrospirota bacterium]|nr:ABC transporter ATP-binding protein [Nitrospirota bacterium]